jgi:hypothetical protein
MQSAGQILLFLLPGGNNDIPDRRFGQGFLILEIRRKVNAVVFADVSDGLRRKLLGFGRDAHSIEDMPTGLKVPRKCSRTDVSQTSEFALGNETVFIVVIDHKNFIFIIDFRHDSTKQVNLMVLAAPKVESYR